MFLKSLIVAASVCATAAVLPADYQSYSAQEKQELLYKNCLETTDGEGKPPSLIDFGKFLSRDINPTFDHESDELYYKGSKPIHTIGSVVKARFDAVQSPFTGAFKGDENVLLRLSLAAPAEEEKTIPGLAVKFLRDEVHSGNFMAMFSLEGQPEANFFARNFSNHVDPPVSVKLKVLEKKFRTASKIPTAIGLSDIAKYDAEGAEESDPVFPFQIVMEPTEELQDQFRDASAFEPLPDMLARIPTDTKLYQVYAKEGPDAELVLIGSFTTTSEFIGSEYGDKSLFFQHQRFEDDLKLKPEWAAHFPDLKESKCPFGFK